MQNPIQDKKAVRLAALNLLARREHSFHELVEKLMAKPWEKSVICEVLTALKTEGLQDDQRFAENYVRFKVNKGFGPVKISWELANKGVDREIIQQHIAAYQDLWPGIIEKVIATKTRYDDLASLDQTQRLKLKLKLERFLKQRGFPVNLIADVFKK